MARTSRPPSCRPCARAAPRPARSRRRSPRPRRRRQGRVGASSSGHRRQARAAADLSLPAQALLARLGPERESADLAPAGIGDADHPLLARRSRTRATEGLLLTGRLSLATHPWLADHVVGGAVLLPGTAFLELALRPASRPRRRASRSSTCRRRWSFPRRERWRSRSRSPARTRRAGARSRSTRAWRDRRGISPRPRVDLPRARRSLARGPSSPEPLDAWPPEGANVEPDRARGCPRRSSRARPTSRPRLPGHKRRPGGTARPPTSRFPCNGAETPALRLGLFPEEDERTITVFNALRALPRYKRQHLRPNPLTKTPCAAPRAPAPCTGSAGCPCPSPRQRTPRRPQSPG